MTGRPWLTPAEVREYSELAAVQNRTDSRLAVDIARAEQYIISYTNNDFAEVVELPASVHMAALLLAEFYAQNAVSSGQTLKSESFDDYSYTTETTAVSLADLDLAALLDDFVQARVKGGVTMRMRRL